MAASAHLRLNVPAEQARSAVAASLSAQGFTVQLTQNGGLDVSRGSLGTTLVAGALAGQDMHVRFDVRISAVEGGSVADFEHSSVGGFFKGGAIGASKAVDVVRQAAHDTGTQLARQGLLEGSVPVMPASAASPVPVPPPAAGPYGASGASGPEGAAAAADPRIAAEHPYGSAAGIPPAVDYANRTNVVAIVAIILGFVVPIGGIIAGAVGLAQVKRTGERGRGLAIAGIIVGSVLTAVTAIAVILLISFAALSASQSAAEPLAPPTGPQGSEETPDGEGGETADVFTLRVGECLDDVATGLVSDVNVIDCASPHTYEVYTDFSASGDTFPGTDELDITADEGCYAAFSTFVGLTYEESALDYVYLTPTEESWGAGDRLVSCLVADPAGPTIGTLSGAGR